MRYIIYISFIFLILGCNPYNKYEEKTKERAKKSIEATEINIGVTWPFCLNDRDSSFLDGIKLALKEINEDGGALGKRVNLVFEDDKCLLSEAKKISKQFAENPEIMAVIGHEDAELAIPASVTYEYNGIVFLSPAVSYPLLTREGSNYIFRNIPSDEQIGKAIAKLSKKLNFERMVILYSNNFYGNSLSGVFKESAINYDIDIIHQRSFALNEKYFRDILALLKDNPCFDSIFIAGVDFNTPYLIKRIREADIDVPILTGTALDSPKLIEIAKEKADGVIVATLYDPNKLTSIATKNFIYNFKKLYKHEPNTWAIQAYDALYVLVNAIKEAKTTIPYEVAQTLRYTKDWDSVVGEYSFTKKGDIEGREIFFKVVENGKFKYLDVN